MNAFNGNESSGLSTATRASEHAMRGLMWLCSGLCMLGIAIPASGYAAQQVYKCTTANGVVFSPRPCGPAAKLVGEIPSASQSPAAPQNDAVREISDSVADTRCRDDARALYREPDMRSIAQAQREMDEISRRTWYGYDARQVQIMVAQDQTRLVTLRGLIATEQARADAVRAESRKRVDAAMEKCEVAKRERENARSATP